MANSLKIIFVEKKKGFDLEAQKIFNDFKQNLNIKNLTGVRVLNKYLINDIDQKTFEKSLHTTFSEPPIENVYLNKFPTVKTDYCFGVELLPGQYDQRSDSARQCLILINPKLKPSVHFVKILVLQGKLSPADLVKIKKYFINPIECREIGVYDTKYNFTISAPKNILVLKDFCNWDEKQLKEFYISNAFAMNFDDFKFIQDNFKKIKKTPTIAEIKVIDTYWSDHCRHTTFETEITDISFEKCLFVQTIKQSYQNYLKARQYVYGRNTKRKISLMDIATINAKLCLKKGNLPALDISDEINACSIKTKVELNGVLKDYLLMFKNETHNHPTEIEPFSGASTCLGGAIRDPLSGRAFVYQAMRLTGSADPTVPLEKTIPGKLPQRVITTTAAAGYSSYGNQIGLAAGQIDEIYHEGYAAKRMEAGAVMAAAPIENVVRKKPKPGDAIILLGGRTGKDGVGGATGSSKAHDAKSNIECGSEVQKGNAVCERNIQRLFANKEASTLIKKCNDFGAGGVAVSIGELAPGVDINLDKILVKYEGLDGLELAISESQERMAIVVDAKDASKFIKLANEENLEATIIATVTNKNKIHMTWKNKTIVEIDRDFLNTNGVTRKIGVEVSKVNFVEPKTSENYAEAWKAMFADLNVCSKIGLIQRFDSTIGAGTILVPLGGKHQITPAEGMACLIPGFGKESNTASLMTYGFNPKIGVLSPYHMAYYSVIESVTKIVAMGGDYKNIHLSLQEYFEKLLTDKKKWGKAFAAMLGAFAAMRELNLAAIGGKDSMSGTYENISVPPTLVAFAVATCEPKNIISPEFKKANSHVVLISPKYLTDKTIEIPTLIKNFNLIHKQIKDKKIISAFSLKHRGVAEAVSKMCLGNNIGFEFSDKYNKQKLFKPLYGSILVEVTDLQCLYNIDHEVIGKTITSPKIIFNDAKINLSLETAYNLYTKTLANVFEFETKVKDKTPAIPATNSKTSTKYTLAKVTSPLVTIVVLPGTNCEFDSQKAWEKAGAKVQQVLIKTLNEKELLSSIDKLEKAINKSNILMLPGGFSGGDEPDGSAKFFVNIFQNKKIQKATTNLIEKRQGLVIGICNGFQALIKLGLVPFGKITKNQSNAPTLAANTIGRHMSSLVRTKVVSNKSPWLSGTKVGSVFTLPVSHGEGRFICNKELMKKLIKNGQVVTQYVDLNNNPTLEFPYNPNGSDYAVEAITSPCGRVLGKMCHSERIGKHLYKNILGDFNQKIFENGVKYFRKENI